MSQEQGRLTVLVVDDDDFICEALEAIIGCDEELELVGVAKDAEEAVDVAQRLRPHVVVLDVKMPRGGGVLAAERIRQLSPDSKLVAFSVYSDPVTVMHMLGAGSIAYVLKGVPTEELIDAIKRAARGQGSLSADLLEATFGKPEAIAAWLARQAKRHPIDGPLVEAGLELCKLPALVVDSFGMVVAVNQACSEFLGRDTVVAESLTVVQLLGNATLSDAILSSIASGPARTETARISSWVRNSADQPLGVVATLIPIDLPEGAACMVFLEPVDSGVAAEAAGDIARARRGPEDREAMYETMWYRATSSAIEEERARVAAELHDEIVQAVVGLAMGLDLISVSALDAEVRSALERLRDGLRATVNRTRALILDLSDPRLTDASFDDATGVLCTRILDPKGISWSIRLEDMPQLETSEKIGVLRIVQEALTNVAKHSRASHVEIVGRRSDDWYELEIRDDGVGFAIQDTAALLSQGHYGITTMKRRAARLGANLDIVSAAGSGTRVIVKWRSARD
jgi:signal transduction histidine kinase/DNA-binding NarL/FixJ family response regulator